MENERRIRLLETLVKYQEDLMKEEEKELRRIRLKNIQLKLHMEVLVSHPIGTAAKKIRQQYSPVTVTRDLLICSQN